MSESEIWQDRDVKFDIRSEYGFMWALLVFMNYIF